MHVNFSANRECSHGQLVPSSTILLADMRLQEMADREASKIVGGWGGRNTPRDRVGKKYFNLCKDNKIVSFLLQCWIYCMVEVVICNSLLQGSPLLLHISSLKP